MRTSIVLWSTVSGVVIGVLVDATLFGLGLLCAAAAPGLAEKLDRRWLTLAAAALLLVIPAASAVLGFIEGRLKAS